MSSAQAAHHYSRGKLLARPQPPAVAASRQQPKYGLHPLGIGHRKVGLVYTPETYSEAHDKAAPLIVMLHGAGGNASGAVKFMSDYADEVSSADWSCNHCIPWTPVRCIHSLGLQPAASIGVFFSQPGVLSSSSSRPATAAISMAKRTAHDAWK